MSIYRSEYENVYGEVWVFEYDYSTNTGTVKGSDVRWQSYSVQDGQTKGLVLTKDEQAWLRSSWHDATKDLDVQQGQA